MTPPEAAAGFTVKLTNFEGPFDLLLSLIAKHRLDITEVARTSQRSCTRRLAMLVRNARIAAGSCSTKTQEAAPRDNASSPSAPEPANRSATARPSKLPRRLVSIENNVSRVRSAVGRVASPFGATI